MTNTVHPSYPNPTIQEAICEIYFRLPDGISWDQRWFGAFFNEVQKEFPNLQPFAVPTFSIQIGQAPLAPQNMPIMRYSHNERPVIIQLSDSRIVVNVLPQYLGWEQMLQDICYAWEKIVTVIKPESIQRLGLRYVNRIERQFADEAPSAWLEPTDYLPAAVLRSHTGYLFSQVRSHLNDGDRITVIVAEQEAMPNISRALMLDIDRSLDGQFSTSVEALSENMTRLHEDIWGVFQAAKGERLERLLKGELV